MKILPDGSVVQDGMNHEERDDSGNSVQQIFYPVKAQVTNLYYLDDPQNPYRETVLLDLITSRGLRLSKVPWTLEKGGVDNYIHVAPTAASANVDGSPFDASLLNPRVSNGDTVLVVFVDGDVRQPHILKVVPHNQSGPLGQCPRPRLGRSGGDYYRVRMNGTNLTIDKDGNVSIVTTPTLAGQVPEKKNLMFTFQQEGQTQKVEFLLDNTGQGVARLTTISQGGKKQEVVLDSGADTLKLTSENGGGVSSIEMSGAGIEMIVTGNLKATVSGDLQAEIQGNSETTVAGDASVDVGGAASLTAGGNATVEAAEIHLNGSAGKVLTTDTDPLVDLIYGTLHQGVPTVKAG